MRRHIDQKIKVRGRAAGEGEASSGWLNLGNLVLGMVVNVLALHQLAHLLGDRRSGHRHGAGLRTVDIDLYRIADLALATVVF